VRHAKDLNRDPVGQLQRREQDEAQAIERTTGAMRRVDQPNRPVI